MNTHPTDSIAWLAAHLGKYVWATRRSDGIAREGILSGFDADGAYVIHEEPDGRRWGFHYAHSSLHGCEG